MKITDTLTLRVPPQDRPTMELPAWWLAFSGHGTVGTPYRNLTVTKDAGSQAPIMPDCRNMVADFAERRGEIVNDRLAPNRIRFAERGEDGYVYQVRVDRSKPTPAVPGQQRLVSFAGGSS